MASRSGFSEQTLWVLAALCEQPSRWRHGYAMAKQTGLKSGTLYPILIRLADRSLVEACWQDEPVPGRPPRHLYRLTADGLAAATTALAAAAARPAQPARPARRSGAGQNGRLGHIGYGPSLSGSAAPAQCSVPVGRETAVPRSRTAEPAVQAVSTVSSATW